MLKVQEIRELIKLVDQSSIDEFVYENEGSKIKMKKNVSTTVVSQVGPASLKAEFVPAPQPVTTAAEPSVSIQEVKIEVPNVETANQVDPTNYHKITSPMVGTFYASPT